MTNLNYNSYIKADNYYKSNWINFLYIMKLVNQIPSTYLNLNLIFIMAIFAGGISALIVRIWFYSDLNIDLNIFIWYSLLALSFIYVVLLQFNIVYRIMYSILLLPTFYYFNKQNLKEFQKIILIYYFKNFILVILPLFIISRLILINNLSNFYLTAMLLGISVSFIWFVLSYTMEDKWSNFNFNILPYNSFIIMLIGTSAIIFIFILPIFINSFIKEYFDLTEKYNQFIADNSTCDSSPHSHPINTIGSDNNDNNKSIINNLNAVIKSRESIIDDDTTINQVSGAGTNTNGVAHAIATASSDGRLDVSTSPNSSNITPNNINSVPSTVHSGGVDMGEIVSGNEVRASTDSYLVEYHNKMYPRRHGVGNSGIEGPEYYKEPKPTDAELISDLLRKSAFKTESKGFNNNFAHFENTPINLLPRDTSLEVAWRIYDDKGKAISKSNFTELMRSIPGLSIYSQDLSYTSLPWAGSELNRVILPEFLKDRIISYLGENKPIGNTIGLTYIVDMLTSHINIKEVLQRPGYLEEYYRFLNVLEYWLNNHATIYDGELWSHIKNTRPGVDGINNIRTMGDNGPKVRISISYFYKNKLVGVHEYKYWMTHLGVLRDIRIVKLLPEIFNDPSRTMSLTEFKNIKSNTIYRLLDSYFDSEFQYDSHILRDIFSGLGIDVSNYQECMKILHNNLQGKENCPFLTPEDYSKHMQILDNERLAERVQSSLPELFEGRQKMRAHTSSTLDYSKSPKLVHKLSKFFNIKK